MSRRVFFNPNIHLPQHVQPEAKVASSKPEEETLPTVVKLPLVPSKPKPKVAPPKPKVPPPPKIEKHLSPAQAIRNAQLKKKMSISLNKK